MLMLSHRFAGITFQSELDTRIPYLEYRHFEKFRVENKSPNVIQRYHGINFNSLTCAETLELTKYANIVRGEKQSPLLNSPMVRELLEVKCNHSHSITIEVQFDAISIYDFVARELNMYYSLGERQKLLTESQITPMHFAAFLPTFSATMLHSSGLALNGRAAVFLAPDEGGKTTVVKQASIGTVLCDDQVVLRRQGDIFMTYGTPWGLIANQFQTARLGGFFLLEQAEQFELIRVRPQLVFDYLWKEHEHYRYFLPKNLRVQAFNDLYEASRQVPCYRMRFSKNYIDWDAVERAMS